MTCNFSHPRRSRFLCAAIAAFTLGGLAALRPALRDAEAASARVTSLAALEAANTTPFAVIMGEFRSGMADLMWVKTERYLHRGVAYGAHIDGDAMARTGKVAVRAENEGRPERETLDEDHEEHFANGLIPAADKDWRGWVGELQRQVHPWDDPANPHIHQDGAELIPWYRLLTYSDPHHWRGYSIGAWWLMQQAEDEPQALVEAESFIDEGIRNNPRSFQLHLMRGRILMQREAWQEAIGAFASAAALGEAARAAGGATDEVAWTLGDEEDFASSLRYGPLLRWRKLDDPEGARQDLLAALHKLPGDGPLNAMRAELLPE